MKKLLLLLAIFIASPLMGQETTKEKQPLKSIFSLNHTLGMHNIEFYESLTKSDVYAQDVIFQMGGTMEYILGKKWHWYLGASSLYLDVYNYSIHTGFGVTFIDTRNAEGIGWMFDWNILTVGTALSKSGYFGFVGTSNIRARYSVLKNFSLQIGWDLQVYSLEYITVDKKETYYSSEIYSGFSVGFAFGR